ncbi:tRNA adenosine(34) deaminase TadA [Thermoproteota archaeon]
MSSSIKHTTQELYYLEIALKEAHKSLSKNEVPIGAIIVRNNIIISRGHNLKESRHDPSAHAELIAIKKACSKLGDWRLNDCTLYSTLEPCPMCAGAMLQARVKCLVYGAKDSKWGAGGSMVDLLSKKIFNHKIQAAYVPYAPCREILGEFFKSLRT